jgi:hypothetical protein
MASKTKNDQSGLNRREVLGKGAIVLGVAAALMVPFKLFGGFSGNKNAGSDLPGKDSIFQPRKDANLKKYLQDKSF